MVAPPTQSCYKVQFLSEIKYCCRSSGKQKGKHSKSHTWYSSTYEHAKYIMHLYYTHMEISNKRRKTVQLTNRKKGMKESKNLDTPPDSTS